VCVWCVCVWCVCVCVRARAWGLEAGVIECGYEGTTGDVVVVDAGAVVVVGEGVVNTSLQHEHGRLGNCRGKKTAERKNEEKALLPCAFRMCGFSLHI
jgi:hypothetical protein